MTTFSKKQPQSLREDEALKGRISRLTESNGGALEDLFQKLDEAKRVDKELVQKLESNYEAIEDLEKEISKEQAINSTRERERLASPQDKRSYSHGSPQELSEVGMGSPGDSRNAGLGNCHTTPYEEEIIHAATERPHYIRKSPSLFISDHPFEKTHSIGPTEESLPRIFDDWLSRMAKDKLPVVTEICFRLWPCGPYSRNAEMYQYTAMIKTDPKRELSDSRVRKLIKEMGYTWRLSDTEVETLSPDYTRVDGHIINPSTEMPDAFSSESSSNSSDDDSESCSDDGDSSKVEEDHERDVN